MEMIIGDDDLSSSSEEQRETTNMPVTDMSIQKEAIMMGLVDKKSSALDIPIDVSKLTGISDNENQKKIQTA